MTTPDRPPDWELWAPPLAPPVDGGLPYGIAAEIAEAWWEADPHLCAALQWEAYAAMLPAALAVAQVSTGAQSVSYGRATPGGDLGAAMARAAWHRSFTGAVSVPLVVAPVEGTGPPPIDWWQRNLEHPW